MTDTIRTVRRSDNRMFDDEVNRYLEKGYKMLGEPTHVMNTEQAYNSIRPQTVIIHMVTLILTEDEA